VVGVHDAKSEAAAVDQVTIVTAEEEADDGTAGATTVGCAWEHVNREGVRRGR
jgi:hypothetical protein